MRKVFKKSISLLLAVSALCILFAFQASALTTNCPECGASCTYNPMPMDLRHECVCPTHGAFYEEDCEEVETNTILGHFCACDRLVANHSFDTCEDRGGDHAFICSTCGFEYRAPHCFVNGFCIDCGIPEQ